MTNTIVCPWNFKQKSNFPTRSRGVQPFNLPKRETIKMEVDQKFKLSVIHWQLEGMQFPLSATSGGPGSSWSTH
jgi:hypothetical protein